MWLVITPGLILEVDNTTYSKWVFQDTNEGDGQLQAGRRQKEICKAKNSKLM